MSCSIKGGYRLQQEQGANQTEYSLPEQAMYIYKAFVAPLLCILSTHQRRRIMFTAAPAARCQIAAGFFPIIKKKLKRRRSEGILEMGEQTLPFFTVTKRVKNAGCLCRVSVLLLFPSGMEAWLRHQQPATSTGVRKRECPRVYGVTEPILLLIY